MASPKITGTTTLTLQAKGPILPGSISSIVDAGEERSHYRRSRPEPESQLGMIQKEPPLSGMR